VIYRKKILATIILLTSFFAIDGFEFFHNHGHLPGDDSKCYVCEVSSNLHSTDNSSVKINTESNLTTEYFFFSFSPDFGESNLSYIHPDRAPPAI
jgi:hypothetical protein